MKNLIFVASLLMLCGQSYGQGRTGLNAQPHVNRKAALGDPNFGEHLWGGNTSSENCPFKSTTARNDRPTNGRAAAPHVNNLVGNR